jgi:transposase-like protein
MTSKRKPYQTYTREFKLEGVRLMNESDRPAAEIARELGVTGDPDTKERQPNSENAHRADDGSIAKGV